MPFVQNNASPLDGVQSAFFRFREFRFLLIRLVIGLRDMFSRERLTGEWMSDRCLRDGNAILLSSDDHVELPKLFL